MGEGFLIWQRGGGKFIKKLILKEAKSEENKHKSIGIGKIF